MKRDTRQAIALFLAFCLPIILVFAIPCSAKVVYVDDDAPGGGGGSSWEDAYKFLQDALATASSDPNINEILVAQGIYRPDETTTDPNGTGDREATFQLVNGVALRGGYAGIGEVDANDRDWELYETVLSGDLEEDDGADFANNGENSYHVFYHPDGTDLDVTAILDGFTITAGNAEGVYPLGYGGGMYNFDYSSPTVTNCNFTGNSAYAGGGMCNWGFCSPTVTNCSFTDNSANLYYGGGMYNWQYSSPTVTNCTFSDNSGNNYGGGMCNWFHCNPKVTNCTFTDNSAALGGGMTNNNLSLPTVTNCTFSGNSALYNGGGMSSDGSNPTVINCIFTDNSADREGGGMSGLNNSSLIVTNCIFSGNSADSGGGIQNWYSILTLINCILWDNTAFSDGNEIALEYSSTANLDYCDIQGGLPGIFDDGSGNTILGTGNIDTDPNFVDPDSNDYHLQSQAGRYDPTTQTWLTDNYTSPCIDAGDPLTPISWEPYPNGGLINMGAYGGTEEASKSYFSAPPCETPIAGDINGDCRVDLIDFSIMSIHWLEDNNL